MKTIIIIWATCGMISSILNIIGTSRCGNRFGWNSPVGKKEEQYLKRLRLYTFLFPGYNVFKSLQYAWNPFKYIQK